MKSPEREPGESRREFLTGALALAAGASLVPAAISSAVVPESQANPDRKGNPMEDKLVVLWTSGDREVALKMTFMYTYNAKAQGWWKNITLVVWGPSAKLLSVDLELREYVQKMIAAGIKAQACKACSDSYGVSENLAALGIEVRGMGQPLTEYLKEPGVKVITF